MLAKENLKPSKLLCHLQTRHSTSQTKPFEYFQRKLQELRGQQSTLRKAATMNQKALQASFVVANWIDKIGKPHTLSETYCMIHRQALAAKKMPPQVKQVMDEAVHTVNAIKTSATSARLFKISCQEMGAEHHQLLYHSKVRWQSRGNVVSHLYELRGEVRAYLLEKNSPLAATFSDEVLQTNVFRISAKPTAVALEIEESLIDLYPEGLREYDYISDFVIRGLHYDVQKALLMKIDAFHYIQLGTVYRGLHPVSEKEVIAMYEGSHVPLEQMSDFYGKSSHGHTMKQFMDIFSLPEMTLLSCVNDYFMKHNIDYEPVHLYKDVKKIERPILGKYIRYGEQTHAVLRKLSENGKKMFLITNSPFDFVSRGMNYIVGKDWRDLFDVVIVQADKPGFFNDRRKPFRRVTDKGVLLWDRIHKLEKGQIYKQGNLYEFLRLTGWRGSKVLYFGDHIYSDLADLTLKHGWRTGAIIPELRQEIKIMNTEEYVHTTTWLQGLTSLVENMQVHRDPASQMVLQEWIKEREAMRSRTKDIFNPQFGSLFRTYHNPTYFSRRLSRFADIYMASLSCLLNYDLHHTFFPRRTPLQHEAPMWPDQVCSGALKLPFLAEAAQVK
ncbi:NT5D3 protein, partial [Amia calva]|nr:NT5D3 protein [Amia calva]